MEVEAERTLKNIKIWNTKEQNDVTFSISNHMTVLELMEKYLEKVGKDHQCRFMYGGRMMKEKE